jgi:WhiB family redox-sensing transcriptional regulator
LCLGMDPELFFPHRGDRRGIAAAKAVCFECPVRRPCLDQGMRQRLGVWGGFSETERKRLRKARRLPEPREMGVDTLLALLANREATEGPGRACAG